MLKAPRPLKKLRINSPPPSGGCKRRITPGTLYKFRVDNITAATAPLLKIYYWECMGIDKLNKELKSGKRVVEHSIKMPPQQINSKPLKIVLWLRNNSKEFIELRLKRVKNCACEPMQTRVGFNQFRYLYRCPHRQMISTMHENIIMEPKELVPLSLSFCCFLYGEHKLTYEVSCNDGRIIRLHFFLHIIGFDPQKCIITTELVPVDMHEYRRYIQPIWVQNITMQSLCLQYSCRDRGIKVANPNLTIPSLSTWPLLVEYRPTDFENQLDFTLCWNGLRTKVTVQAPGVLDTNIPEPKVPLLDYDSVDFLYVVSPNKLEFQLELGEVRSLLVAIHNHDQKCLEFHWQNYCISAHLEVTFEPPTFRLKPHHSKLCMVVLRAFERPIIFRRIPLVLEIHRIFDRNTRIAKELLQEIESIDDPKWGESSFLKHVLLHLNVKVNLKKEETINLKWEPEPLIRSYPSVRKNRTTIFEKLFWEYLSKSDLGRESKTSDRLTYKEVLTSIIEPPAPTKIVVVTRNEILKILNQLTAEACSEISQNWRFVPHDLYYEGH